MADNLDAFMLLSGIKGECLDELAAGRAKDFDSTSATIEIDNINISCSGGDFTPKKKSTHRSAQEKKEAMKESEKDTSKYTFTISKQPDASSPSLFFYYCQTANSTGDRELGRIAKAEIWVRKAAQPAPIIYLRWQLEMVWITKFDWSIAESGDVSETLELFPYKMRFYYQPQDSTGAKKGNELQKGFDLQEGKVW